ncbi:rho guanine nucleotide exchange factor 15 isoform X1 [Acipenser oxyrinchus oxyrinchus]|uniref:Rho guanine nucleotide exchange factor 15 isoform X1 n=1 Tax=Acipenser oxyrinchus oxyrinchus TaxID=40147 RepID=A0AAD8DHE0_ACIOX|nr:rho guanine nucleotide exchange factor 15 isoform X1 [Acipenser oxyrinchus oxyrinchus]
MGTMEVNPAPSPSSQSPSLPSKPKPQPPPKPQPRGTRVRRATEVLWKGCMVDEEQQTQSVPGGDRSDSHRHSEEHRIKHLSLPTPYGQLFTVAKNRFDAEVTGSSHTEDAGIAGGLKKPLLVPKPRLRERPQQSESSEPQNTVNKKRDSARTGSSSYKTMESTPPVALVRSSSDVKDRRKDSGLEEEDEVQAQCPPCCPCLCHLRRCSGGHEEESQTINLREGGGGHASSRETPGFGSASLDPKLNSSKRFSTPQASPPEWLFHTDKKAAGAMEYESVLLPHSRPLPKKPHLLPTSPGGEKEPSSSEGVYMEIDETPLDNGLQTPATLTSTQLISNKGYQNSMKDSLQTKEQPLTASGSKRKEMKPPSPAAEDPVKHLPHWDKNKSQSRGKGVPSRCAASSLLQDKVVAELRERFPGGDSEEVGGEIRKMKKNWKPLFLSYAGLVDFIGGKRSSTEDGTRISPTQIRKTKPPAGSFMEIHFLDSRKQECAEEGSVIEGEGPPSTDVIMTSPSEVKKTKLQNPSSEENQAQSYDSRPGANREMRECLQEDAGMTTQEKSERSSQDELDETDSCHSGEPNPGQKEEEAGSSLDQVTRRIPNSRRSLKPYWQELSVVQESGILPQLKKQEVLLQESMYEVVTTEHSYLSSLTVAVVHFMDSPELSRALGPRDRKSLFSSIGKIKEISKNFLEGLKEKMDGNLFCDICDVIQYHSRNHFSAYIDYVRNMPYQELTLHNLGKEKGQFVEILSRLQEDPMCNRLPLKSFLVLPFQRITRLKILVETILKRTEQGSEGEKSAERALKEISKVLEDCNREVGNMKQMEELVHIANKTEFECKGLALVSSSRWLVKQGDLMERTDKENIFGQKKSSPIYLFLFNDLLLVTARKGVDRFVVQDHAHRSLIEISDGAEEDLDTETENTFLLVLLKNHRSTTSQRLLKAATEAEKNSWIEALTPKKSDGVEVYEEWDCPQVECTVGYTAQQPGELSLEPDDVINVIQKTPDGWLEGRRLGDGERGWFPRCFVKEISNEHVQRRNLRQRHRVLQTANKLVSRRISSRDCRVSTCFR